MHYEMNLVKKFLKTITGKRDIIKVRQDLQRRGIQRHLWLTANPKRGRKMLKPAATYVLSNAEFQTFGDTVESLKTLTGYSSAFGKHIQKKIFGALKSHDYHVLMQQVMPLALHGLLKSRPRMAVMKMCKVFRKICMKVYVLVEFHSLEADVAENMALLEMEFPPLFLTS